MGGRLREQKAVREEYLALAKRMCEEIWARCVGLDAMPCALSSVVEKKYTFFSNTFFLITELPAKLSTNPIQ